MSRPFKDMGAVPKKYTAPPGIVEHPDRPAWAADGEDIVKACVKWLLRGLWTPEPDPTCHKPFDSTLSSPDLWIENLVGHYPTRRPYKYYLFQHKMRTNLEGFGARQPVSPTGPPNAVVVSYAGGWGAPNPYNTLRLPRISLTFWCDPLRDSERNVIEPFEVYRRIEHVYESFDKYLHRPQGGTQWWSTLRTLDCTRLGELSAPEELEDGMLRAQVFYGCQLG